MPRFKANRWWAFVLALGLVTATAVASHAGSAGMASGGYVTGGGDGDGGGNLNPPPVGDPDAPGNAKGHYSVGHMGPVQIPGRSVGDGSVSGRVWTMRLGTLLQITRIRLFGI